MPRVAHPAGMETRIALPRPPVDPEPAAFPWLASLAPVLGAGALWLWLQTPGVLAFALLGPLIAAAALGDGRRARRRRIARDGDRWRAELAATAARVDEALDARGAALAAAHPAVRAVAAMPAHDPHRWRREAGEALPVVLGIGPVRSGVVLDGEVSETDAASRRLGAAEEIARLRTVAAAVDGPVVLDARDGIGFAGDARIATALARSAVVQLLEAVPPDAAAVIAPDDPAWDWLAEAPHPLHREPGRVVRLVGDDVEATVAIGADAASLPRECRAVVRASLAHLEVAGTRCRPDALSEVEARAAAATLARAAAHAGLERGGGIPSRVDLADLPVARGGLAATFLAADAPIELDLVRDGPHAVVGGTTGSGKSELLIAWVAAMAQGRSTDEVAFLLVDFKGGASFAALEGLRHAVGVMTDLDEGGARRAIESLRAELRSRERRIAEQGARSIEEVRGMPRLVIVVDEFAAMLQELPDLHRLFVDLAARGRSLGVHLILCTQRPAEAVRDALLANCGIRISLRVTDEHDAMAVTGTAEAAGIALEAKGRCVVRIAGGATRLAQAALAEPEGLARLVAASASMPEPERPWREPLPPVVALEEALAVERRLGEPDVRGAVRLGLIDRPAQQTVAPALWRPAEEGPLLVIGGASSGRTSAAELVAAQLGTEVVDREDALWDALEERGPLVVDDVELQLARLGDEHQAIVVQRLARRMREGDPVALTARRITSAMGQLAPLAERRVLLRIASRQEHVVAGGTASLHDAALPPGAGWIDDERVQLAIVPDAAVPEAAVPATTGGAVARRAPRHVRLDDGPVAVVLGVGASAPARLVGAARPGAPEASSASAVVGTVAEWEGAWGELDRMRAERPVVVLGVDERQVRQLLRHAPTPPPMRSSPAWVLRSDRFERLAHLERLGQPDAAKPGVDDAAPGFAGGARATRRSRER